MVRRNDCSLAIIGSNPAVIESSENHENRCASFGEQMPVAAFRQLARSAPPPGRQITAMPGFGPILPERARLERRNWSLLTTRLRIRRHAKERFPMIRLPRRFLSLATVMLMSLGMIAWYVPTTGAQDQVELRVWDQFTDPTQSDTADKI